MIKSKFKVVLILFLTLILVSTGVLATDTNATDEPVATSETNPENTAEGDATTTDDATTSEEEISEEDIKNIDKFYSGENVEISDLVNGNVFAIGKNVKLTGKINGDFFVIAENLTINPDNTEAFCGNLFAVASEINMDGGAYDAYLVCDKFNLEYNGVIDRDLRVTASEINLNGIVGRNAYLETNKLVLDTYFLSGGNVNYTAQTEAVYMQLGEDGETATETTTIPTDIMRNGGTVNYTHRDKKILKSEVKKSITKILNNSKVKDGLTEEEAKAIIASFIFSNFNVKSNSELVKNAKSGVVVPAVYIYINVIVIIALVLALILPKINKTKKEPTSKEENKE